MSPIQHILVNVIHALDEVNANRTHQEIEANPSQISIRTSMSNSELVEIALAYPYGDLATRSVS